MSSEAHPESYSLEPAGMVDSLILSHELTDQRLALLQQGVAELRESMPEYVGMTLFGSMARKETRPDSDADVFVFIRPESDAQLQHDARVQDHDVMRRIAVGNQIGTVLFNGHISIKYFSAVKEKIEATGIPRAGVITLPISEKIVAETTTELLQNAKRFAESGNPDEVRVPRNVRALFHVPIDDEGLVQYRNHVLTRMAEDPNGNLAWRMVRHRVLSFEVRKDQDDIEAAGHRYFPGSLEEACQSYLH